MNYKLVSVVIPTYERPRNLCRAIESVLKQSYQNIEIIVVDDNGLGEKYQIETENILNEYIASNKIKYIKNLHHKNGSYARNTGLFEAKGEYVNFLDDDDVFDSRKIELQVQDLEIRKEYDAAYCNIEICNGTKKSYITNKIEGNVAYELLSGKIRFNTSTVLFRKKALLEINGWDDRFQRHQDWELMVRFFRNHKICLSSPELYLIKKYKSANTISKQPLKAIDYAFFFLQEMKKDIELMENPQKVYKHQIERLSVGLMAHGQKEGLIYFRQIFKYGMPSIIACIKFMCFVLKNAFL